MSWHPRLRTCLLVVARSHRTGLRSTVSVGETIRLLVLDACCFEDLSNKAICQIVGELGSQ